MGAPQKDEVEYLIDEILMSGPDTLLNLRKKGSTLVTKVGRNFSINQGDEVYGEVNLFGSGCNIYDRETGKLLTN